MPKKGPMCFVTREQLLEQIQLGKTVSEIVKVFPGSNRSSVYYALEKFGIKPNARTVWPNKIDWSQLNSEIKTQLYNYDTLYDLAEHLGVSNVALQKHLVKDLKIYRFVNNNNRILKVGVRHARLEAT